MKKAKVVKRRIRPGRGPREERVGTREDLTTTFKKDRVTEKVRMRVVIEVDLPEDTFSRDAFNETVIEWAKTLENFDAAEDCEVVLLTTEEHTSR
jgi:hypothetical protein